LLLGVVVAAAVLCGSYTRAKLSCCCCIPCCYTLGVFCCCSSWPSFPFFFFICVFS